MITRCENSKSSRYKYYGAKGVKVCERWKGAYGFVNFLEDMGVKPTEKHSIDRIDTDGNYEPSNCRWTTQQIQILNRGMFKNNTSGIKGVSVHKNKFYVCIKLNHKTKHLGIFDNIKEAKLARQIAEDKYFKPILEVA